MAERLDDQQRADKLERANCPTCGTLCTKQIPHMVTAIYTPVVQSAGTRLYWLVESAAFTPRRYWTTNQHRANSWEIDPAKAIRYATQEEAMRVVMMLNEECEACEHMDCSGPEPELVLDKPAQIGSTRFGVGVKWSTVIDRAQREHEYQAGRTLQSARTSTMPPEANDLVRMRRDARRYCWLRDHDMTAEYDEYITGNMNGRGVDPLDATIDKAMEKECATNNPSDSRANK